MLVTVTSPSRLHFGLYGFGQTGARRFGGVGAMIQSPAVRLTARPSASFDARGLFANRVQAFAAHWTAFYRPSGVPACQGRDLPAAQIEVEQAPPEHCGLGVGTQLGLSVAAALNALYDLPPPLPAELAQSVGRGQRSAVGTYGFVHGGLIAERGKLPGELVSPLDARVALPAEWRFVLVTPLAAAGLAGQVEIEAFEHLPPVPLETTEELVRLAREQLFPAAARSDFAGFSAAVDRYCYLAGQCFAAVQGGAYNGPLLAELVETMHHCGASGVGQSSWGPTLFAVLPSESAAQEFAIRLRESAKQIEFTTQITSANNQGVEVSAWRGEYT